MYGFYICTTAFNGFVATYLCWFILPGIVIISLEEEGSGCCSGCHCVCPRFCGFTFYDSSLCQRCQGRAAIFDYDTPWRSLHCFVEFGIHLKSTKSTRFKFKFVDGTLINCSTKGCWIGKSNYRSLKWQALTTVSIPRRDDRNKVVIEHKHKM